MRLYCTINTCMLKGSFQLSTVFLAYRRVAYITVIGFSNGKTVSGLKPGASEV